MSDLPPIYRGQREIDADHLKILMIFHFVVAGLALAGIGFLLLHYAFVREFFENPSLWRNRNDSHPPKSFLVMLEWVYIFVSSAFILAGIGIFASGLLLRRRGGHMFSPVVAGLNCLWFPFGTILGAFTLIVLLRDSVRELYEV